MGSPTTLVERELTSAEVAEILAEIGRREFIIGAAALGALLVGCSSDDPVADPSASGSGPWSFVDDRGVDVSLPSTPQRIVAYAPAAAALWDFGIEPVGIYSWSALDDDPHLANMDLTGVTVLGTEYGVVNLEAMAALDPDVLIDVFHSPSHVEGFVDAAQQSKFEAFVPVLGLNNETSPRQGIDRFAQLARALGANTDTPAIEALRARFEASSAAIRDAASAKPGLKVMAVSPQVDGLYVAQVEPNSDLRYYRDLGVDFVVPTGGDRYFEALSWENVDTYPADAIIVDSRTVDAHDGDPDWPSQEFPTWRALPAVKAGQVGSWHAYDPFAYSFYDPAMEQLADLIERSDIVSS